MPIHNAEAVYRKIVMNEKCPQHSRISALKFLSAPSLTLLKQLATDKTVPGRLAALAADLYAERIALKQISRINGDVPDGLRQHLKSDPA